LRVIAKKNSSFLIIIFLTSIWSKVVAVNNTAVKSVKNCFVG